MGYGKRAVLTEVDLVVEPGAFLGILGHNGSGKSTILKTLLGLIPLLGGRLVARRKTEPPRYGYVPQKEKLDPIYPLSVDEVAAMGAYRRFELSWKARGAARKLALSCLEDCGALDLASRRYSDLSNGQRQRVLIARALAAEADILVLDEPLAGIDVTTQKSLLRLMKGLKEKKRLTVLMVSHRLEAEKDLFTHIAWVDEGKVEAGAAPDMLAKRRIVEIFGE